MSTQNRIAKRANQTVKNLIRAILKDSALPNEFQVKAIETNVYLRNLISNGPEVNRIKINTIVIFKKG